jgi:hypothetical protein
MPGNVGNGVFSLSFCDIFKMFLNVMFYLPMGRFQSKLINFGSFSNDKV